MDSDHHPLPAEPRVRTIVGDGRQWLVREFAVSARAVHRGPCLVFESPDVLRIVRVYPANWYILPDDELYSVSLHA